MRIAYLHNIDIELDSRAQKEVNALRNNGNEILFCGWDKEKSTSNEMKRMILRGTLFKYENICIKVEKGRGIKENFCSLIKYEFKLLSWLLRKRNCFDAIHVCSFDIAIIALPIAKIFKKKIVYDIYDDYADSHVVGKKMYSLIKRIDAVIIKHVDTVIICSEGRIEQIASKEAKKIVVIHNTPDILKVDSQLMKVHSDKFKIVYVGNLNEGRYTYEIAKIITDHPNWEFHCGGSGVLEKDIQCLAQKYLNIYFYGKLKYEETLSLESNCDVITAIYDPAIKNHKYAAPNKFYEAVFLGKPTIMIHNTGMDTVVNNKKLGITTNLTSSAIENALETISDNLKHWKEKEQEIRQVYQDEFSWDIMQERLLKIYQ